MFDRSGTGKINRNDLKDVLGQSESEEMQMQIEEIMTQIDTHHTGDIDFGEFKTMMTGAQF